MSTPLRPHDFVVNVSGDLVHVDISRVDKSGLKILLEASYPEATHDDSSHPTSCFPRTRHQYIEDITGWAQSLVTERHFRMMWMQGPAGVGKSSLAQSCAERVGKKLAAAFFFSRPNSRDISTRLFPSISYQLSTKYHSYRDKLEEKIRLNPTLVHKSIAVQFRELIAVPLQDLWEEGQSVEEGVIFIDGLDECTGEDAQCTIIDTIATSVRNQTTPFIWAFFSRPEPRIVAQFGAPHVHDLCWHLMLSVSHDADEDIELYLRDCFRRIRAQYGIPSAVVWPSEEDVQELVQRSAGLFIYPTSVARFVGGGGPLGPEEQLRLVLRLPSMSSSNPWSHLDVFYTHIMEQIPNEMLPIVLKLLHYHVGLRTTSSQIPVVAAAVLDLSLLTYCVALSKLHSVVKLTWTDTGLPKYIGFHHASFTDFLKDPNRSGRFHIGAPEICQILLADVIRRHNGGFDNVTLPWYSSRGMTSIDIERSVRPAAFNAFWKLASCTKLDGDLLQQLSECNYRNMAKDQDIIPEYINGFFYNIPPEWRRKIMRPYCFSLWPNRFGSSVPARMPFILGGDSNCEMVLGWRGISIPQDHSGDPLNSQTWIMRHKWLMMIMCIVTAVIAAFASSTSYSAYDSLVARSDIHTRHITSVAGTFFFGYVTGPLFWGTCIELMGHRTTFLVTMIPYTLFHLRQSLVPDAQTFRAICLLSGVFTVAPLTNYAGVWPALGRGSVIITSVSSVSLAPVLSPVIGGFIVQMEPVRAWEGVLLFLFMLFAGCYIPAVVVFLPHRYTCAISPKAVKPHDHDFIEGTSVTELAYHSIFWGLESLRLEPILIPTLVTVYLSIVYALFYTLSHACQVIFAHRHDFTISGDSLTFISIGIGIGTTIGSTINYFTTRCCPTLGIEWRKLLPPERRHTGTVPSTVALIVGIFWLEWTGGYGDILVPQYVRELGTVVAGVGIILIFMSLFGHLADMGLLYYKLFKKFNEGSKEVKS